MSVDASNSCEREFDFALIADGVDEITTAVEDALFEAGCDDATLSMRYGLLYIEFSRTAASLKDAIISAIRDVQRSGVHARVLQVDECNLVTASEIARRVDRSRQLVHQYITGARGPGGFPPPVCHLDDRAPLWAWCAVTYWLAQNQMVRPEVCLEAEVVEAINAALDESRRRRRYPGLADEIASALRAIGIKRAS